MMSAYVTYCPGTVVTCNRCDKTWRTSEPAQGQPLHTTAARIITMLPCPHCTTVDCHWLYARNNPDVVELHWEVRLLELHFPDHAQAAHAHLFLDRLNIKTFWSVLNRSNVLVLRDAADAEAAIHVLNAHEAKRIAALARCQ